MVGQERIAPQEYEVFYSSPLSDAGIPNEAPIYLNSEPDITKQSLNGRSEVVSYEDLISMDAGQLMTYIRQDLAKAEIIKYEDSPDAESKLAFLGGNLRRDVSKLTTLSRVPIYSGDQKYVKIDETEEFLIVANFYANGSEDVAELALEAADVFYNAARLIDLDSTDDPPNYLGIIKKLAESLGWSEREALLLTAFKYHRRFVDQKEKDPAAEKKNIELLFKQGFQDDKFLVNTPTREAANEAFNFMDRVKTELIVPRYNEIRAKKMKRELIFP